MTFQVGDLVLFWAQPNRVETMRGGVVIIRSLDPRVTCSIHVPQAPMRLAEARRP